MLQRCEVDVIQGEKQGIPGERDLWFVVKSVQLGRRGKGFFPPFEPYGGTVVKNRFLFCFRRSGVES